MSPCGAIRLKRIKALRIECIECFTSQILLLPHNCIQVNWFDRMLFKSSKQPKANTSNRSEAALLFCIAAYGKRCDPFREANESKWKCLMLYYADCTITNFDWVSLYIVTTNKQTAHQIASQMRMDLIEKSLALLVFCALFSFNRKFHVYSYRFASS